MENIPTDPFMLMSFLNMKLRDNYDGIDELCEDLNLDKEHILKAMHDAGFEYDKVNNKFW